MPEHTASLTEFIRTYEQATNSHDITQLVPLIASGAVYWFSDGSHRGREAILSAIAKTFATIRDEIYQIDDLEWIAQSDDHAICRYRFAWTGTINSRSRDQEEAAARTCSSTTPEPGGCSTNTSAHNQAAAPIHRSCQLLVSNRRHLLCEFDPPAASGSTRAHSGRSRPLNAAAVHSR